MKLADREIILGTHAEHATGPGWSNDWLNVFVFSADGQRVRTVGVQWDEMTEEMRHLFAVCAAANKAMLGAVMRAADQDVKP